MAAEKPIIDSHRPSRGTEPPNRSTMASSSGTIEASRAKRWRPSSRVKPWLTKASSPAWPDGTTARSRDEPRWMTSWSSWRSSAEPMPRRRQPGWRTNASTWASGPATRATTAPTSVAGGGQGHHGGLVLVERLDDVAPAVGGAGGRSGQVDEAHDLLDGGDRIAVPQGQHPPGLCHRVPPVSRVPPCYDATAVGRAR